MRLNLIQLFTNSSTFMCLIYIPLFAEQLGATHTQIGIIGAVYGIALFISSYMFGRAADMYSQRMLLYISFAASALFFSFQMFATTPQNLAFIRALAGFSAGMFPPVLISYVHSLKKDIGKFSSFGALGWTAGALIAGIIANLKGIFFLSSIFFLISFILLVRLPDIPSTSKKQSLFSIETIKKNWNIYITYFTRHAGACSVWIIFPLYLKALGAQELVIGLIYSINPILQFFFMQRLKTDNSEELIKIGYLASIIAFASLYFVTAYYQVVFSMIAVAVSWSFMYVGSVLTLLKHNTDKGTSIGLLTAVIGIAAVFGSFIGGGLYDAAGSLFFTQIESYRIVCGFASVCSALSFIFYKPSYYQSK
ncbi:MAG: MFS transporter [Methanosarcinales archaeon]|uniref:MFS transporter n=1 Tax=Candidatus Ethanoperedens thermophilum TaxID=2766897 RepID=A0A848DB81_9EURY|nr:MFS transporter [Candidatus Ethanoperedens thermophilum]